MVNIEVKKCDTKTGHAPNFFHDRNNNQDWLLMCFQTPFLYYKDGKMTEGKPGDCLINSPGAYTKHGPTPEMTTGFQNDWMYFSGSGIDDILNQYKIPVNSHFGVNNPNFLTNTIQTIMYEKLNKQPFYKEKISFMVQNLFVDISRCITLNPAPYSKRNEAFEELRNEIFNSVHENWTLEKMADYAGYSVSRFCYLYKSLFKTSPSSDLLHMRIQKSKNLLSYSDFSIGQVAIKSGFASDHHFSYAFKKIAGMTPTEYRNKNKFFKD